MINIYLGKYNFSKTGDLGGFMKIIIIFSRHNIADISGFDTVVYLCRYKWSLATLWNKIVEPLEQFDGWQAQNPTPRPVHVRVCSRILCTSSRVNRSAVPSIPIVSSPCLLKMKSSFFFFFKLTIPKNIETNKT